MGSPEIWNQFMSTKIADQPSTSLLIQLFVIFWTYFLVDDTEHLNLFLILSEQNGTVVKA